MIYEDFPDLFSRNLRDIQTFQPGTGELLK